MKIIRLTPYTRAMRGMGLDDNEIADLENAIARAPDAHPLIRGLRGARKARFPLQNRGKSGGGRAIYFVAVAPGILFMMAAYRKNERSDLSTAQRKAILLALADVKGGEM